MQILLQETYTPSKAPKLLKCILDVEDRTHHRKIAHILSR